VNATDFTGQTALHWTAVRGSIQVAELLLQSGARIECADSHGYRVRIPSLLFSHPFCCMLELAFKRRNTNLCPTSRDVTISVWLFRAVFNLCIWLLFRHPTWLRNMDIRPCYTISSQNGVQKRTLLTTMDAALYIGRQWFIISLGCL
jgi:hypothetical protein